MKTTTHLYRWFVVTINIALLLVVIVAMLVGMVFKAAGRMMHCLG